MRLDLSARVIQFPQHCACCDRPAGGTLKVSVSRKKGKKTETKSWSFPYCAQCLRHVWMRRGANWCAVGGAIASFLVGQSSSPVGMLILTAGLGAWGVMWDKATAARCPTCVATSSAVEYLGWNGSVQSFQIRSDVYARRLANANHTKVR